MIITNSLNILISFLDSLFGTLSISINLHNELFEDMIGHIVFVLGRTCCVTVLTVFLFFLGLNLVIRPILFIWRLLPFT